ncbi:amino-acid N-acetyltransferase [Buchananella hordeovulneris]|uniref:N-acetylglutamate synthase n=1 Tax=Buchananella hordeovulneris TaxID=52770 RepID=A0A1Q5PV16_9ACTO|nr:amino-acid N-acetyltransferase [Buchananella hordeovulneris]OKL51443.1 N-acetylglutamate synthase [Buchananella hordeovulneris]
MAYYRLRQARVSDVPDILALTTPYVEQGVLVRKPAVAYYESIQEFLVALHAEQLVGCGALHVMWQGLAEIRTLAVDPAWRGRGVGDALVAALLARARGLEVDKVFCLTFETAFFARHGFVEISAPPVDADTFAQLTRSPDLGVGQFLDLEQLRPNTLGNTRMLAHLRPTPRAPQPAQ